MSKYNRTFHFSFSPEIHSDDKTLTPEEESGFIGKEVVITEKLDGGNACLKDGKVFARTHSSEASHPSFSMLKALNNTLMSLGSLDLDEYIFGENMEGIHSIEYTNLKSPFYIFGIKKENTWYSWREVEKRAEELRPPTVPVIFQGRFSSLSDLKNFLNSEIQKESLIGGEREGFVVRTAESFKDKDFRSNIAKFVRKGHVQSDEHWSKNWKRANIDPAFWSKF